MIEERLQSLGSWDISLRADTPRAVLDLIQPFSMVAVFSSFPPLSQGDAAILGNARYVGIVHRPGPQLRIGGPGVAAWLGQDTTTYDVDGTATLPESLAASAAGATLDSWLDTHVLPGTPFTRGTTGPAGTMVGSYQFISQRNLLDALCAYYGAEWRINTDLSLDVAAYTTLYGATPTVVLSKTSSGREIRYTSLHGDIVSSVDVADYASRVVVLGSAGRGVSGGSSPWVGPENVAVKVTRIIEAPDVMAGAETSSAATFVALLNSLRRQVDLSTDDFDVAGDLAVGSLVYLHDPDAGIVDLTQQIWFRGEVIHPVTVRCMAVSWPVQRGMGVALRTNDGSVEWTDITRFVEVEESGTRVEIGAAQPYAQGGDAVSLRADLKPRLAWAPWQAYTATVSQTGGTFVPGNATIDTRYRRDGTRLEVIGQISIGSTTTFVTGDIGVDLPSGLTVSAFGGSQLGTALYTDSSAGQVFAGQSWIHSGSPGTIFFRSGVSPMAHVTEVVPFTWASSDGLIFSITIELAP